jgi:predicted metalloprotease with PDZ domain
MSGIARDVALGSSPVRMKALAAALALALAPAVGAHAPEISSAPYPGEMTLRVDATDLAHRIFRVRQEIPVAAAGPLRLYYPQWLPGNHGPRGPVDQLGGLRFSANGQPLPWKRDPLDMYSFLVDVPAGAGTLVAEFEHLSPLDPAQGRVVMTPEIVGLQWNAVALYPAGHAADAIRVRPSVVLPAGWGFGTALEGQGAASALGAKAGAQPGGTIQFDAVDFETLVDSPLIAGKHYKRFVLREGPRPVYVDAVADSAKELAAKDEVLQINKMLVTQGEKLFQSHHFAHYHFLLSVSERYAGIGLEHHQSTEVGVRPGFLTDTKRHAESEVMAHEYVHSWNGKFRRGADLTTAHFNTPMQDSLLWVYEGQTQYWGNVLAARIGQRTPEEARDNLAAVAASYAHAEGRAWRPLADTTNQPIISARRPQAWRSWQRGEDYYSEGELVWLDADTLIREKSGGKRSLDDFAARFFGVEDGRVKVLPYTFDDVVAALNAVEPHDWAGFLRDRVEKAGGEAPLDGLARGGWKLVYNEKKPAERGRGGGGASLSYSLGMSTDASNKITSVLWNSVAFKAGLAPGMTLLGVNGEVATPDRLTEAVTAAKGTSTPIVLLVNSFDRISTVNLDYHGGLRYPHLERIPNAPDRLSQIHAPRK